MPISKTFEFYDVFNYQIMKLKESGIMTYIEHVYQDKYGGINRPCEFSVRQKGSPIDLYTVISAIAVFITGLVSSVMMVVMEMLFWWFKTKQDRERAREQYTDTTTNNSNSRTSQISVQSVSEVSLK